MATRGHGPHRQLSLGPRGDRARARASIRRAATTVTRHRPPVRHAPRANLVRRSLQVHSGMVVLCGMTMLPRRMKRETWLTLFSNGDVEVLTGPALEEVFRSGLVDARTRVRAVSSPIWETLGEVAGLSVPPSCATSSLVPVELEGPVGSDDPRERSRPDFMPSFSSGRTTMRRRLLAAAATVLALAGVVALGASLDAPSDTLALGARMSAKAPASASHRVRHVPASSVEPLHQEASVHARRSAGRRDGLRQREAGRPLKATLGSHGSSGRHRNMAAPAAAAEPAGWEALRNTNRFDPLDGSL